VTSNSIISGNGRMAANRIAEYQMVQISEKMQVPVNELKRVKIFLLHRQFNCP